MFIEGRCVKNDALSRGIETSTKGVISFPREIPYIDTQLLDGVGISRGIETSTKSVISFPREIPYIDTQLLDGVGISRGIETSTMVSYVECLSNAGVSKMTPSPEGLKPAPKV